MFSELVSHQN